jgi:Zn-dependent protease with chaperone function
VPFVATLALLPLTALALLPFWAVLNLVTTVPFVLILVLYLVAGSALLVPAAQRLVLAAFFDARTPTPRELEILEPAWHNVLDAAGEEPDDYVLAITDSSQLDAVATGGHIVAVSRLALNVLPAHELEASLAHELGHHVGSSRASRLASLWLEAPLLLFARLGIWLELAAYGLALWFAWQENFGPAVGALLGGLAIRAGGHLVPAAAGAAGLVHSIRSVIGRYSIYQADRHAVELGYGEDLADLLERMVEYQMEGEEAGARVLGSHSLITRRIERIEEQLAS